MSKIQDRAALDKMVSWRTSLLVNNGFFGFLALQLRLKETYDIPTAAVDGVTMYYNPKFIHQLTDAEGEFLIAHEVMHCCFQHFTRRGNRDPVAWNVAGDFVINLDLQEAGFTLIHNKMINGKNFKCCIDAKYKGMSTEEIYDTFPVINILMKGIGDGEGGGWNVGGVDDHPGDANKGEDIKQTWEQSVRAAIQVAQGNNAGNIPGSLKSLIAQLNKPKVSWRDLTMRFIDQSMSKAFSWSRINRRSVSTGILMPGLISDSLNKLVFFSDISGSVSFKMQKEMISEIAGALDSGTADTIVVAYADTEVQAVDEFVQGDLVTTANHSGGGTAFSNSFKWLMQNHPDASCVIYLTDLQVYDFGEDPGIPVMWAVFGPSSHYQQLVDKVPFGTGIHVSENE